MGAREESDTTIYTSVFSRGRTEVHAPTVPRERRSDFSVMLPPPFFFLPRQCIYGMLRDFEVNFCKLFFRRWRTNFRVKRFLITSTSISCKAIFS